MKWRLKTENKGGGKSSSRPKEEDIWKWQVSKSCQRELFESWRLIVWSGEDRLRELYNWEVSRFSTSNINFYVGSSILVKLHPITTLSSKEKSTLLKMFPNLPSQKKFWLHLTFMMKMTVWKSKMTKRWTAMTKTIQTMTIQMKTSQRGVQKA